MWYPLTLRGQSMCRPPLRNLPSREYTVLLQGLNHLVNGP